MNVLIHQYLFNSKGTSRELFSFAVMAVFLDSIYTAMSIILIAFTPAWKQEALLHRGNSLFVLQHEC